LSIPQRCTNSVRGLTGEWPQRFGAGLQTACVVEIAVSVETQVVPVGQGGEAALAEGESALAFAPGGHHLGAAGAPRLAVGALELEVELEAALAHLEVRRQGAGAPEALDGLRPLAASQDT